MIHMHYSARDYDELAETATLEQVQKLYYEKKIRLVSTFDNYLLKSLFEINRKDEIIYWIFEIEPDISMILLSQKGDSEAVRYLFEKCDCTKIHIDFALCQASRNGHLDVVKCLIKNGADVNAQKSNALQGASQHGK